jgi:hypothetical protein
MIELLFYNNINNIHTCHCHWKLRSQCLYESLYSSRNRCLKTDMDIATQSLVTNTNSFKFLELVYCTEITLNQFTQHFLPSSCLGQWHTFPNICIALRSISRNNILTLVSALIAFAVTFLLLMNLCPFRTLFSHENRKKIRQWQV